MKIIRILYLILSASPLLFINIYSQHHNPKSDVQIDSIIITSQNGNKEKESYAYDEIGNRIIEIDERSDDSRWTKVQQKQNTYNNEGKIIHILGEDYFEGNLIDTWYRVFEYDLKGNTILDSTRYYRRNYFYDADNNLTKELLEEFNAFSGQWDSTGLWEYEYDSNKKITKYSSKFWEDGILYWAIIDKYTYDIYGNEIIEEREYFNGDIWSNGFRNTNSWDENSKLSSRLSEIWDGTNWVNQRKLSRQYINDLWISQYDEIWDSTKWIPSYRFFKSYDLLGNEVFYESEEWDGEKYENSDKKSYEYDNANNVIYELDEKWDGSKWINEYELTYGYDEFGNATSFLSESLDEETKKLKSNTFGFYDSNENLYSFYAAKVEIFYNTLTDINTKNKKITTFSLDQNYPNPFNPLTTIRYTIANAGNVELIVYNLLGERVKILVDEIQNSGSNEIQFDAGRLSSGIYYYKLKSGNFNKVKKMLLLK